MRFFMRMNRSKEKCMTEHSVVTLAEMSMCHAAEKLLDAAIEFNRAAARTPRYSADERVATRWAGVRALAAESIELANRAHRASQSLIRHVELVSVEVEANEAYDWLYHPTCGNSAAAATAENPAAGPGACGRDHSIPEDSIGDDDVPF